MLRATVGLVVLCVLLAGLGVGNALSAPPQNPGAPSCLPGDALENENVRIWFHGFKGFVKVFDNSEGATGLYQYTTGAIVEEDADGQVLAQMKLDRAFPQTSTCTLSEDDDVIRLEIEIKADVRRVGQGPGKNLGDATATFVYAFNTTANGAKFDLRVADWPWQGEGNLAYRFRVQTTHDMEVAENGIGFSNNQTGEPNGHIEWAENATATYADGNLVQANVTASWTQTPGAVEVTLRFVDVAAGYTALDYDPWVSMGDWIIIGNRLVSLDVIEQLVPLGLYRTVRNLL